MKYYILCIIALAVIGCGTQKRTNILKYRTPYSGEVTVVGVGVLNLTNSEFLGTVSVGETGFTSTKKCTYQAVINDAILLARSMGGNVICITKHIEPGWSSCHQIQCDVYYKNK